MRPDDEQRSPEENGEELNFLLTEKELKLVKDVFNTINRYCGGKVEDVLNGMHKMFIGYLYQEELDPEDRTEVTYCYDCVRSMLLEVEKLLKV